MYKQLIRAPLEHMLILIWLLGLARLVAWLSQAHPSWSWIASAVLGAIGSALIAGRYRKPKLFSVSAVLGLGATLAVAHSLGFNSLTALATVTVAYGLVLWRVVIFASAHKLSTVSIRLLALEGGYGIHGGRRAVEDVVHWTVFALSSVALFGTAAVDWVPGTIPSIPWTILALSITFLWLAGERYQQHLHCHLVIALSIWGVICAYAWAVTRSEPALTSAVEIFDAGRGPVLVLCSLGALVWGEWIGRNIRTSTPEHRSSISLYTRPLQVAAVALALAAVIWTGASLITLSLTAPAWTGMFTFGLASAVLLAANRIFTRPALSVFSALLATTAISWAYNHGFLIKNF